MKNKKMFIWLGIAVLLIILLIFLRGNEDSWIKDSRGVWIKHGHPSTTPDYVIAQQAVIGCAQNLLVEKSKTENISSQCLGSCFDYSVDTVHVPRIPEDDMSENQCSEYLSGITKHFIEIDSSGDIVRVN